VVAEPFGLLIPLGFLAGVVFFGPLPASPAISCQGCCRHGALLWAWKTLPAVLVADREG
jgi:hypothetical protein